MKVKKMKFQLYQDQLQKAFDIIIKIKEDVEIIVKKVTDEVNIIEINAFVTNEEYVTILQALLDKL